MAILHIADAYGDPFAMDVQQHLPEGRVVLDVPFTGGRSSYAEEVDGVASAVPDCVVLVAFPDDGGVILRDWNQLSAPPPVLWIGTDGIEDDGFPRAAGRADYVDGVIGTAPIESSSRRGFNADRRGARPAARGRGRGRLRRRQRRRRFRPGRRRHHRLRDLALRRRVGGVRGCGDTEVFELAFPSVEAFSASETARVYVVPVAEDGVALCSALLTQGDLVAVPPPDAVRDTGPVPVCELRGRVTLPSVREGLNAYVAVTQNTAGAVLLSGCTLENVYDDSSPVRISLATTDRYRTILAAEEYEPTGCSVEDRCSGACP